MDLNKVQIIGRLTRDPEIRTTPGGKNVCSFSVATGFTWTDQAGQKKEQTEFHNVVAWGKLGDIIGQYMKKGRQIYIEGRLATTSWDDKTSGQKRYKTEIVAENMIMLGSKPGEGGATNSAGPSSTSTVRAEQPEPQSSIPEIQIDNDDLPF
ncbi:MAG: single-stranded DNA-binding protein [Candidatus Doudnabacteria bacterium]|nr:single-stranded DNA-binding protein [Candidatus Doudnabacteria bacterium]